MALRYRLIYFFGPDGTGKTTHADLTSACLRARGYRVWRASVKQHHTLSYLLLRLLRYTNDRGEIINHYGFDSEVRERVKTPWKILELISLLPAITYRAFLPLLVGYIVICDRYVLDTVVALSYFLNEPKLVSSVFAKLVTKLIPKKSLLIHLDADTDVILQRKKNEPLTTQLIEYYKKEYSAVKNWLKSSGITIMTIDTAAATVEEVQETILQFIG